MEIKLHSSPFLRTLMTAAHIAKELNHPLVRVNYAFSETLITSYFDSNPIDKLLINTVKGTNRDSAFKKYFGDIYIDDPKI